MADNIAVTAGSGTSIATDDVGGVHYQRVKLSDGTADGSAPIASGNGVSTNALRVTLSSDSTGQVAANPSKQATTDDTDFVTKVYSNTGAVTDGIVWSPAAGKRWYVTDIIINTSAACIVTLEDDKAGGDEAVLAMDLGANAVVPINFRTPLASGEDEADLIVTTSAGNIYITAIGYEV